MIKEGILMSNHISSTAWSIWTARTFQKAIGKSSSNLCKHAGRLFMKEEIGMHLHTASRRWGLGYAVSTKRNTMEFLRTVFADENLFMWKIFMRKLRKQEVTEYCVTWYLFLLEKQVHTYMYKFKLYEKENLFSGDIIK